MALLLGWMSSLAKSEIVFDNITGTTQFGGGISTAAGYQGGNIVSLAGTARDVTRVDVLLYEFGAGVTGDFRVNLWSPSGVTDDPGTLLWTSPVLHAVLPNRTPTVFSVDVPAVHVPNAVGWTVEGISNAHSAGVVGAFPATVGTIVGQMIFSPTSHWDVANFSATTDGVGFRLFAVPEPSTTVASIAVLGLAGLTVWRRRSAA